MKLKHPPRPARAIKMPSAHNGIALLCVETFPALSGTAVVDGTEVAACGTGELDEEIACCSGTVVVLGSSV